MGKPPADPALSLRISFFADYLCLGDTARDALSLFEYCGYRPPGQPLLLMASGVLQSTIGEALRTIRPRE
jgi:hypothetical protein